MNKDLPWLLSYEANTPTEININEFPSIVAVLDRAIKDFADRPAFSNFGKQLSYREIDNLVANLPIT